MRPALYRTLHEVNGEKVFRDALKLVVLVLHPVVASPLVTEQIDRSGGDRSNCVFWRKLKVVRELFDPSQDFVRVQVIDEIPRGRPIVRIP